METPLWSLLLLCLCVPGRCDCQRDCLTCGLLLPKQDAFNALVCLVECEEKLSPALNWDLCHQAVELLQLSLMPVGGTVHERDEEDSPALASVEAGDREMPYSQALQRFTHMARALGINQPAREKETAQLSAAYRSQQLHSQKQGRIKEEEEEEEEDDQQGGEPMEGKHEGADISLSKRFGGFLKGKYGYRKLMGPGRSMQKRYGGFIGIRKSARKWNNQKRFSQFLKQYLSMTSHSSEVKSVRADLTQNNEI